MLFNVADELHKLNKIVNGDENNSIVINKRDIPQYTDNNCNNYLLYTLNITKQYPKVETYLHELLNNFTVNELNNFSNNFSKKSILHYIIKYVDVISFNSIEMILKLGVDVNIQNNLLCTELFNLVMDYLMINEYENEKLQIINLLIKYGANLNILNCDDATILDEITYLLSFNDKIKTLISILIDFGATINEPNEHHTIALEYIKDCEYQNVKRAIK